MGEQKITGKIGIYKGIKNPLYRSPFRTVDFQLITSMGLTSLFIFIYLKLFFRIVFSVF